MKICGLPNFNSFISWHQKHIIIHISCFLSHHQAKLEFLKTLQRPCWGELWCWEVDCCVSCACTSVNCWLSYMNNVKSHIVPVARMDDFRALKLSSLNNFRALKLSRLEAFRALKLSCLENFRALNPSNLVEIIFSINRTIWTSVHGSWPFIYHHEARFICQILVNLRLDVQ